MKRRTRVIGAGALSGFLLLVMLAGAGLPVCAQTTEKATPAQSASPQTTGSPKSSAPTANAPVPPAPDPGTQPVSPQAPDAQPDVEAQLTASAPMLQFSLSMGIVNFGGSLSPGQTHAQSITAVVNSNQTWRISVTKSGDLQGASGSIPSSYFTFGAVGPAGRTTYQAPAGTEFGTDTLVVAGNRGSNMGTTIAYRLTVPWDLEADSYSAAHTYTAVQI